MAKHETQLQRIKRLLLTDIKELGHPADIADNVADITKSVVDCAVPLQWLSLPLMTVAPPVSAGLFGISLVARFYKFYSEKTKQKITLEDYIAQISQIAYLESYQYIKSSLL